MTKICPTCLTEFPDNTRGQNQVYCSPKCKEKARRERDVTKPKMRASFEHWINIKCKFCGKTFTYKYKPYQK